MARRAPNMTEKIAALLLMYWDKCGDPIPFEIAKQMSAKQICALVEWDHAVFYAWGGTTHPTNITPRITADHRRKTRKEDIQRIAKMRQLTKPEKPKRKMKGRGFPTKEQRAAAKQRHAARLEARP
jgi:hypothetical protein